MAPARRRMAHCRSVCMCSVHVQHMHTVGTCTTQHLHDAAGAHAGALLVWVGWALVLGPASYLASYVPLLGGLVGCMHGSLDTWCPRLGVWTWGHRMGA